MKLVNWLRIGIFGGLALTVIWGASSRTAYGQTASKLGNVPAVFLSDLHFDPFDDPAKVPLLIKAPVEDWDTILKSPDSKSQEADFAGVQKACKGKLSVDASYALLKSALDAAKYQSPGVKFVTVSGDLIVHDLDCRYRAAMHLEKDPNDDQSVSAGFAEKATVFVMKEVEHTFANVPVYLALGNNDSRCKHNRLDENDGYLKATAQAVLDGLRGVSVTERKQALETYQSSGYYAVTMAAPMVRTRLLVLDDIYMMTQYATCEADDKDRKGADEQIAWLGKELDSARRLGERVWVLGHVPPAVNPLHAVTKGKEFCASGKADAYLSSDDLANAMSSHADVIQLGLFGHTHMDELHLLQAQGGGVPIKVVASVSAVDGNRPSFTVGEISPRAAKLIDYTVFIASNTTGIGTNWSKEYAFDETYHESSFSGASVEDLVGRFRKDGASKTAESQAYELHFFKGGGLATLALAQYWSGYVCSIDHPSADGFKACVCSEAEHSSQ